MLGAVLVSLFVCSACTPAAQPATAQPTTAQPTTAQTDAAFLETNRKKAQQMLQKTDCPADAAQWACYNFERLVNRGDEVFLTQFAAAFIPPDRPTAVYAVFDDRNDRFWVVTTFTHKIENGDTVTSMTYAQYQKGRCVTFEYAVVPLVGAKTIGFNKNGVSVEQSGKEIRTHEVYETPSFVHVSIYITLERATGRAEIREGWPDVYTLNTEALYFTNQHAN